MSHQNSSERLLITGMGAALVDLFADVDEAALDELGSPKGSMTLVDTARADALPASTCTPTAQAGLPPIRLPALPGLACRAGSLARLAMTSWAASFKTASRIWA